MAWPRLVFGETSRERELRALVEGLQAERERKDARIAADREVHERAVTALRDAVETAIAERDAAIEKWGEAAQRLQSAHLFAIDALDDFEGLGRSLRCLRGVTQPDDSQDDRPATDCGADGAGTTPE